MTSAHVGGQCRQESIRRRPEVKLCYFNDYRLGVVPLSPADWQRNGGRRLQLLLKPRDGRRAFDLRLGASGIAVWAGYALEEAARRVWADALSGVTGTTILRPTVLIIDEPERHLHPNAQREVAEWLKYEAYLLADEGRGDSALETCQTIINIGRIVGDEGLHDQHHRRHGGS